MEQNLALRPEHAACPEVAPERQHGMLAHKVGVIADGAAVAGAMGHGAIGATVIMVHAAVRLEIALTAIMAHAQVPAATDLAAAQQVLAQVPVLGMNLNALGAVVRKMIAVQIRPV